ncbi:MAG: hypothetical protein NTV39_01855 [Candidatus Saccharibacteria bacterium]|nr:hypothetical protein [Candidatus Saccharibacteria bacterium]
MDTVHKLEKQVEEWLKPLPHLPEDWRKWIANNVWWIVLIGVILSVIGGLALAGALFAAMGATATVNTLYSSLGVSGVPAYTGWWYAASAASLVFLVITVVIDALAVSPLKAKNQKGWDLLFLSFLIGVLSSIVGVVLNVTTGNLVGSLIGGVIGVVISAYFLFEIRSYFKQA